MQEISLNEDEPNKLLNLKKEKQFKKVKLEKFEHDLINPDKDNFKNHLIVIKKKRNREPDNFEINSENNQEKNFKRKKTDEFQQEKIPSSTNNLNLEKDKINIFHGKLRKNYSEKYDFSLKNISNNNPMSEENLKRNNCDSLKNFSNRNFAYSFITDNFSHENSYIYGNIQIDEEEDTNIENETNKEFIDNKHKLYINELNKIKKETQIFKNFYPTKITKDIINSIKKKDNLEIMIQEQNKINELKKMILLDKRNLLTKKRINSEFKNLQNKYINLFGDNFTSTSKIIKDDEIMVIHVNDIGQNSQQNLENFLSEIKNNNKNIFDFSFYEVNNSSDSNFNFKSISEKLLLDKINECDEENNLYYEKENPNPYSDKEENFFEDNDSNRESHPAHEYPDEESSNSDVCGNKYGKNYDEDDDYEVFADCYNSKQYKQPEKGNFSYQNKINKMEKKLNKEFESMILSDNKKKNSHFNYYEEDSDSDIYADDYY